MKLLSKKITCLSLSLGMLHTYAYEVHVMRKDDTISQVLVDHKLTPLYGKYQYVDQTFKLNNLNDYSSKRIPIGTHILLPLKKKFLGKDYELTVKENLVLPSASINITQVEPKKDDIKIKNSMNNSRLKYGLIDNLVSDHQDVIATVKYHAKNYKVKNKEITQNENFSIGLVSKSNNNYQNGQFFYNPIAYAEITNQGSALVEGNDQFNASFSPNVKLGIQTNFQKDIANLYYGILVEANEASRLDFQENNYRIRRDQSLHIGLAIGKTHYLNLVPVEWQLKHDRSIWSKNMNDYESINIATTQVESDIYLTQYLKFGMFVQNINFENSQISNTQNFGGKFSYLF